MIEPITIKYHKDIGYHLEKFFSFGLIILIALLILLSFSSNKTIFGLFIFIPLLIFAAGRLLQFLKFDGIYIYKDKLKIDNLEYNINKITIKRIVGIRSSPDYAIVKYDNNIISEFYLCGIFAGNPTRIDFGKLLELIEILKRGTDPGDDFNLYVDESDDKLLNVAILFYLGITALPIMLLLVFL